MNTPNTKFSLQNQKKQSKVADVKEKKGSVRTDGDARGGEAEGASQKAVNNVKYEPPSPAALGVGTQKESVFIK